LFLLLEPTLTLKKFEDFFQSFHIPSKSHRTETMNTLEQVIEQVFNPSSKDMRLFKEALLAQKDLSSLFNSNLNNKDSIEKTQTNQIRKPRAAPTPKPDDVRCQAVTWNLEMDDTTGQLKPKRCTRACDNGANFCKQHGLPDGKKCPQCSAHFCEDIIHQFKYEHMGTIHEASWAFEKYHSDVLKIYQKSSAQPSNDNHNDNTVNHPTKKESKKTKNTPKDENKPKRPLNPYMVYLKDNRKTIEQEVLLANPELKGKELQNAITKRAGELWKIAKETNTYIPAEQTNNNDNDNDNDNNNTPTEEINDNNNNNEQDQEQDEDDNDDNTLNLTFHENLKVWYDSETDLYYDDETGNEAKGSIVNNILKPFKVAKK